ncbi:MAG: glycosyltransferase family 2 protein [Acidobacteriota bacterium]
MGLLLARLLHHQTVNQNPLSSLSANPLVSIVTPTFNMGRFLSETMDSVLSQDYPNIEYIVMDAASTDNTVDILRDYERRFPGRFTWISKPDNGQSDAVNKGFLRSQGEIFTFLNSDDTYLPGAVSRAVAAFQANPEAAVVYGDAYYTAEDNSIIRRYPVDPYDYSRLGSLCHICQPAAFLRAEAFREAGMLDTNLHLTLDYDLWLKISDRHPMFKVDQFFANSRMWADNKTLSRRRVTFQEVVRILKKHRGYVPLNWIYGYAAFLRDGNDGFYQHSKPTIATYLFALAMGFYYNPLRFHRFLGECISSARAAATMLVKGHPTPHSD